MRLRTLCSALLFVLACTPPPSSEDRSLDPAAGFAARPAGRGSIEVVAGFLADQLGGRVVAVGDFVKDGTVCPLGTRLSDELTGALIDRRARVVERRQLSDLLRELKLGDSGLIDPATRGQVGRFLGAEAIVVGNYEMYGDDIRVLARVVGVETALGIAAVEIEKPKTPTLVGLDCPVVPRVDAEDVDREVLTDDRLRLTLTRCRSLSGAVRCEWTVTNEGLDSLLFFQHLQAFDPRARSYLARLDLGDDFTSQVGSLSLPAGTQAVFHADFLDVPFGTFHFSKIEIRTYTSMQALTFRNVPID